MFWNIFLLEKDKLFNRAIFWIELTILTLIIVLVDVGLYLVSLGFSQQAASGLVKSFTWPVGLLTGVGIAGSHAIGGLLLVVLIGTVTAQEYSWRTVHMWLCHGVSRPTLLGAKLVAALLPTLIVLFSSLLVGGGVTAVLTYAIHGNLSLSATEVKQVANFLLITGYSLLPYVTLTFLLAVLTRSIGATIGICLAFIFLVEGIVYSVLLNIGGAIGQIGQYLPVGLTNSLLFQGSGPGPFTVSANIALLGIALYTLVFAGITFVVFQRQSFSN